MPTIAIGLEKAIVSSDILKQIETLCPDYRILVSRDRADFEKHFEDIEIAAANMLRPMLHEMPKLRWFQQWGAGADWLQTDQNMRENDVILTNASGVHPVQISEHVFAMLLAFARQLPKSLKAQSEHEWIKFSHDEVFELADKTMLIMGVGAIGERIVNLANAFGMQVIGMKRHPEKMEGVTKMVGPEALHEVLPEADVVVLTIPYTQETKNFIGKKELELMKDSACLINIGRGGTIDEAALLAALNQGKFRGVGLDVFEEEPLPESSAFWEQERVMITPHYSGLSPRYHERAFEIFLENLRRYSAGEALINVVDKQLGY
ncbi:MAG: D-2-hydroxyacid dehydrogenase [Trueperaceae bacterium]|nr:D-2-hydroxyacid dehydrogenase [Trueperaceae bacterium]